MYTKESITKSVVQALHGLTQLRFGEYNNILIEQYDYGGEHGETV